MPKIRVGIVKSAKRAATKAPKPPAPTKRAAIKQPKKAPAMKMAKPLPQSHAGSPNTTGGTPIVPAVKRAAKRPPPMKNGAPVKRAVKSSTGKHRVRGHRL